MDPLWANILATSAAQGPGGPEPTAAELAAAAAERARPPERGDAWEGQQDAGGGNGRTGQDGHAANGRGTGPRPREPVLIALAAVQAEPVLWLWRYWLARGVLAVLDGDPGLGKSTMTLDLAARVSRGWAMPPLARVPDLSARPAGVLLLGAEDSLRHTVRPRLDALGADLGRIHGFAAVRLGEEEQPVVLPHDLDAVAGKVRELGVALIVIDPFMAFLGSEYDSHRDQDIRRCLRPLTTLAEHLGVTILLLRHLNKLAAGAALYRGGASIGITGAARSSLLVGRDPDSDGKFILAMNKANLGPLPTSLAYRLEAVAHDKVGSISRIKWEGESALGPNDILGHGPGPGRPDHETRDARRFLLDLFQGCKVATIPAVRVREEADELSVSWRTVCKAKAELKIRSVKTAEGWAWELPAGARARNCCNLDRDTASDPFAGT